MITKEITKAAEFPEEILSLLPKRLVNHLDNLPSDFLKGLQEIRIRSDKPLIFSDGNKNFFSDGKGNLSARYLKNAIIASKEELTSIFEKACEYSVNTHMDEIINGFVTIRGGHRIGVCGRAVLDHESIRSVRDISSLNIRIAKQITDYINQDISKLFLKNCSVLICGAPSSGKTTLLKQIMALLTNGKLFTPRKVSVIDERFELMWGGIDADHNCDLLLGYPKGIGILQAVRTLSPDIIILDELGTREECEKILDGINCGVNIVTTLHCKDLSELKSKPNVMELIDKKVFDYIIFLEGSNFPGQIKEIIKGDEVNVEADRMYSAGGRIFFNRHI